MTIKHSATQAALNAVKTLVYGLAVVLAILLLIVIWPRPAAAQMCTDREVFVEQLDANYAEQSERLGLMPNGNILEVFSSPGGSFTIIVSDPAGKSCMIASGEGWSTPVRKQVKAKGEPL